MLLATRGRNKILFAHKKKKKEEGGGGGRGRRKKRKKKEEEERKKKKFCPSLGEFCLQNTVVPTPGLREGR